MGKYTDVQTARRMRRSSPETPPNKRERRATNLGWTTPWCGILARRYIFGAATNNYYFTVSAAHDSCLERSKDELNNGKMDIPKRSRRGHTWAKRRPSRI